MSARKRKAQSFSLVELHRLERIKRGEAREITGKSGVNGGSCPRNCECKLGVEGTTAEVFILAPDITEW
jgi:hypothetical protein